MSVPLQFFGLSNETLIASLFILAVVFGVLELSNVFKNRAVHFVVSLAVAFFASTYPPLVSALWTYLPSITWFFIVMFFIAFALELFGVRKGKEVEVQSMVVGGGVLLVLLSIGWTMLQYYPIEFPLIGGGENLLLLLGIIFILSLFWGALKLGPGPQPQKG
ncbi:MAG: hypothetical protein ACE5J7_00130 [Candidatus Aenigmatarchaeota archaeon]